MKKLLFLLAIFCTLQANAQPYYISFTGTGLSTVKVQNLTSGVVVDVPAGDESNVATYGRLYTWYAVMDSRNVCPTDWHVPTDAEWTTLENYLIANGYNYDGATTGNKIAKALASTTLWILYTGTGVVGIVGNTDYPAKRNATGFTALPGGIRSYNGTCDGIGKEGNWWSSSEFSTPSAWFRSIYFSYGYVYREYIVKHNGYSVRCLRDL
jgi:uncharacterized protein (TIGR02145 family)